MFLKLFLFHNVIILAHGKMTMANHPKDIFNTLVGNWEQMESM